MSYNNKNKLDEKTMLDNIGKIAYTLDKAYISKLTSDYAVVPFGDYNPDENVVSYSSNIRALNIERWVFDKDEKIGDCFKNVLGLFADGEHSVALVVKKTSTDTKMYFVTKNAYEFGNEFSKNDIELLNSSLQGNFPGTKSAIVEKTAEVKRLFDFSNYQSVATLISNPSEKSENYVSQGLDKLLNGIVPKNDEENYDVVFLAESVDQSAIREILSGFEEMATTIHPFLEYQFQEGSNSTSTTGEMDSISNSTSVSHSISKTHSVNIGLNSSSGTANTTGTSKSATVGASAGWNMGFQAVASISGTLASTAAKTLTSMLGLSAGYGYSWGKTDTDTTGTTDTKGTNSSVALGDTESTTYSHKSYTVDNMLKKLDSTMERIDKSQGDGLWRFSTYVFAKNGKVSKNVANYLRSITQGDESFVESATIQEWSRDTRNEEKSYDQYDEISQYVSHFTHPIFVTYEQNKLKKDQVKNAMAVLPTSYVETEKLSNVIAFPKKSLQGLPVIECVRFGREPHSLDKLDLDLSLGCAYHMQQKVEVQPVGLSSKHLTAHTFITGSTGSGKSNTIYKMLDELSSAGKKFLVIEPTKGEYKNVFGTRTDIDVKVYGTNPKKTKLLRINPFAFHEDIHVLEHIDRLIDIFNVCWPMYAAMPAILKDAVERAYVVAGWDLQLSENKYDEVLYPTFEDVQDQISVVLNESEYSADNKGDYVGALSTRVRSLTTGINGMIFTNNALSDKELFENNVIVDLSRVGSMETKALIMGLLVMKLSEYYMASGKQNADLQHVTVLEEAHNLLKRTSTEQSTEGSNLLGKSVEMLSNAIAEMRTYGEGFIIADQSPHMLDMSAIRNTNTKIIMKLPDASDRELVGKSANLNDDQIVELSRLETGVAAVYQNNWLEPVLCKVEYFPVPKDENGNDQKYELPKANQEVVRKNNGKDAIIEMVKNREVKEGMEIPLDFWKLSLKASVKSILLDIHTGDAKVSQLVYALFYNKKTFANIASSSDGEECINEIAAATMPPITNYDGQLQKEIVMYLLEEQSRQNTKYQDILEKVSAIVK